MEKSPLKLHILPNKFVDGWRLSQLNSSATLTELKIINLPQEFQDGLNIFIIIRKMFETECW
jgi:hypothetical protein